MSDVHDDPQDGTPDRRAGLWRWLSFVVRLGLAVVFGWSGIAKAADPLGTEVAVRAYSLLPEELVGPVASVLPWFEIGLALLLVVGLATRAAAIVSAVLMAVFIAGVASAAARGLSIDCGCFGGGGAVFLLMAGYLAWRPRTPLSLDGVLGNGGTRQA